MAVALRNTMLCGCHHRANPKVRALTCYDIEEILGKALKKVQKFAYPLPIEMLGKVCSRRHI